MLRSTISQVCHDDRNPLPGGRPALRRSHARLSEPSRLQKQSALVAACSLADQIATTVEANPGAAGRLGRIPAHQARPPRDDDLSRTTWTAIATSADLARLRAEGVDRLLCLSTDAELDWAGVPDLGSRAEAFGLNYRWLPVPDQGTCSLSEAADLVRWCRDGVKRGESVVLTCMGGLGRSGMIAACTLVDVGAPPTAAIASVRAARGRARSRRSGQEELVSRFAAS